MVVAHPDGGFTVLTAEEAFSSRRVRLAPSGGILRMTPRRSEAWREALLQVSVSIPGARLPSPWLDHLAYAIGRPSRTAVHPGARSGFFLPGLPAGPIAVTITAALRDESGGFGGPSVVAGPIALELPLGDIKLPRFPVPGGESAGAYLERLVREDDEPVERIGLGVPPPHRRDRLPALDGFGEERVVGDRVLGVQGFQRCEVVLVEGVDESVDEVLWGHVLDPSHGVFEAVRSQRGSGSKVPVVVGRVHTRSLVSLG